MLRWLAILLSSVVLAGQSATVAVHAQAARPTTPAPAAQTPAAPRETPPKLLH